MSYQLRKAEPAKRAHLPVSHVGSEIIRPVTDATAPRRIDLSPPPPLVARLDLPRARWQNKNALICPIIYVSPAAPLQQPISDVYPQIIALAPPDLWGPVAAPVAPINAASILAPASPPIEPTPTAAASPVPARLFAEYDQPRKHLSVAVPLLLVAVLLLFVATYIFTIR